MTDATMATSAPPRPSLLMTPGVYLFATRTADGWDARMTFPGGNANRAAFPTWIALERWADGVMAVE